jgi:RHS repeat-associated protein
VQERYAYTAYGQPTFLNASATVQTSSAAGNRYTYTAREWDATLGLHHFRARWMSGLTGRFLTRDPIGYRGGISLYEYVNSSSLSLTDPYGLCGDDSAYKKCVKAFDKCLADSVAQRNTCLKDAADEARDLLDRLTREALRQYRESDRLATEARRNYLDLCEQIDRSTLSGQLRYSACVAAAEADYWSATGTAGVVYAQATARIAAMIAAFEAGKATACLILYLNRNDGCGSELAKCLGKIK